MNNLQKWFLIGAICLIAISLFMIGLQRYEPMGIINATMDKWTGTVIIGKVDRQSK